MKSNTAWIEQIGRIDPRSRPVYGHVRTIQELCSCENPRENHFGFVFARDERQHYPQVKVEAKGEDDA